MSVIVLFFVATLLLASCAGVKTVAVPIPIPYVDHWDRGYAYRENANGTFTVLVKTDKSLPEARRDIGCPCSEERVGVYYQITPPKKIK